MPGLAYETYNDLPEDVRALVVDLLNQRLADAIDLQTQTKQAHWNVKGSQFFALHKLFDEIHAAVEEYVDLIAERIVQLGGIAEGTIQAAAERSELPAYPLEADGTEHIDALAGALAGFGRLMRGAIEQTETFGDRDTADICTEISRGIDKWLWFVESHLYEAATEPQAV